MKTFTTSKGFTFTKHELGWVDDTTQLLWHSEFKTNVTQYEAEKMGTLPTREQFIEAEKHGIRELPDMEWEDLSFWSSTRYPGYGERVAYVFYGISGNADGFSYRSTRYGNAATRFVTQLGSTSKPSLSERIDQAMKILEEVKKELE